MGPNSFHNQNHKQIHPAYMHPVRLYIRAYHIHFWILQPSNAPFAERLGHYEQLPPSDRLIHSTIFHMRYILYLFPNRMHLLLLMHQPPGRCKPVTHSPCNALSQF